MGHMKRGHNRWVVLTSMWMLAHEISAFAADGDTVPVPFQVQVVGSGRPMLLIPGLASSGAVWNSTVEHYRRNYQCHVLTLAGFAGQPPIPGPFLETMRKSIADYIRQQKLEKPVIVGHSLGGSLAYWVGVTEPDLVGPLVTVDSPPCFPALFHEHIDSATQQKQAVKLRQRMEHATRDAYLQQQHATLRSWIRDQTMLELAKRWGADSDQATVAKAMEEVWRMDLRAELGRIASPVLIIAACSRNSAALGMTKDMVVQRYTEQTARIAHRHVTIAEHAKHFVMFDTPTWMFAQIDTFLASSSG